jgi:hypothetical protein
VEGGKDSVKKHHIAVVVLDKLTLGTAAQRFPRTATLARWYPGLKATAEAKAA